jgi:cystine transport system permease protein
VILVTEMFRKAQEIAASSNEFLLIYTEAALIYWMFCTVLAAGQNAIEKRLDRYVAH